MTLTRMRNHSRRSHWLGIRQQQRVTIIAAISWRSHLKFHRLRFFRLRGNFHRVISQCQVLYQKVWLALFADADFAGDKADCKSIGGGFLVLTGPNTYYPLGGLSKKHGCTSHSTAEAEIVSLNTALRTMGLPSLDLWELILGRPLQLVVYEDNQATIKIIKKGCSSKLRHVSRHHKVDIGSIHETPGGSWYKRGLHRIGKTRSRHIY